MKYAIVGIICCLVLFAPGPGPRSLHAQEPPDTSAPVVTITSPAAGAIITAGASVTLSMTSTDNIGVVSSGFTIGGVAVTSPTILATPGPVTVTATAQD